MKDIRVDNRWKAVAALSALLLALAVVFFHRPVPGAYPSCLFHTLTGLYCPGCGSTRAVYQLLHGHPAAAFGLNPLLVLVVPVLAYVAASWLRMALTGKGLPDLAFPPWVTKGLVCLMLVFWIARNVPVSPFTWLAP